MHSKLPQPLFNVNRSRLMELCALLELKNGFYAYGGALLVRALSCTEQPIGITQWNKVALWNTAFQDNTIQAAICFAEDVFGSQVCLMDNAVYHFDPETGTFKKVGDSLDEWATGVASDSDFETGEPLLRQWEQLHGTLRSGEKLTPKQPFVLNGQFSIENLYTMQDHESMTYRAYDARP